MARTKKRKRGENENGTTVKAISNSSSPLKLSRNDARKILDFLTHDQLLDIVQNSMIRDIKVLNAVRSIADRDAAHRKLFVRGLNCETTSEKLRSVFSSYGKLAEAAIVIDKATGKSKCFGFVTFKHIDGAVIALKEPNKKIDGRITVTMIATSGSSGCGVVGSVGVGVGGGSNYNQVDISMRKIYVANVPNDMSADRLLGHFWMYGEIEEGPLGFDKATGKSKGFALFVYKTAEAAKASLVDPIKNIDGHRMYCKLGIDGKRGNPSSPLVDSASAGEMGVQGGVHGNEKGGPSMLGGQSHGPSGGISSGSLGAGVGGSVGVPVMPGTVSLGAGSNLGVSGGFSSISSGPYAGGSHVSAILGTGYVGPGGAGAGLSSTRSGLGDGAGLGGSVAGFSGTRGGFGGVGAGLGGSVAGLGGAVGGFSGAASGSRIASGALTATGSGMGAIGRGSSLYSLASTSSGMSSGDYPRSAHYSLSSTGYQGQHNQPLGASAAPRVQPGGLVHGIPPCY